MEGKNKGGISDAELKKLKEENGSALRCGSIEDQDNPAKRHYFYFKEVDKDLYNRCMALMFDKQLTKAQTTFHAHAVLWEEPALTSATGGQRDKYIMGIGRFIGDSYKVPEARLEEI